MQQEPICVTITYPSGGIITLEGQGVIAYVSSSDRRQLSAIAGQLSLGDMAQLICELMEAFGMEDAVAAVSLAVLHRRSQEEESP